MKQMIPLLACATALLPLAAIAEPVPAPSAETAAALPADAAAELQDLRERIMPQYLGQLDMIRINLADLQERLEQKGLPEDEREFILAIMAKLRDAGRLDIPELERLLETEELDAAEKEEARQVLNEMKELATLFDEYVRSGNPNGHTALTRMTPLHLAVMHRKEALVRELLRQGANPNARVVFEGREMDSPLSWAVGIPPVGDARPDRDSALRLIDMLVAAGAEVRGEVGGTMLFLLPVTSFEGAEEVYLHLVELGADPAVTFGSGNSPVLHHALLLQRGWHRAAARLLEQGRMRADEQNEKGRTLLQLLLRELEQNARYEAEDAGNKAHYEEMTHHLTAGIALLLEHGGKLATRHPDGTAGTLEGREAAATLRQQAEPLLWLKEQGVLPLPREEEPPDAAEDEEEEDAFAGHEEENGNTPPPALSEQGRAFLDAFFVLEHQRDAVYTQLGRLLATVTDQASADAAAAEAGECVARLNALHGEVEKLVTAQKEPEQLLANPADAARADDSDEDPIIDMLLVAYWGQYPTPHPEWSDFADQAGRMDEHHYFGSATLRAALEEVITEALED